MRHAVGCYPPGYHETPGPATGTCCSNRRSNESCTLVISICLSRVVPRRTLWDCIYNSLRNGGEGAPARRWANTTETVLAYRVWFQHLSLGGVGLGRIIGRRCASASELLSGCQLDGSPAPVFAGVPSKSSARSYPRKKECSLPEYGRYEKGQRPSPSKDSALLETGSPVGYAASPVTACRLGHNMSDFYMAVRQVDTVKSVAPRCSGGLCLASSLLVSDESS